MQRARLLIDPPLDGPANMARDEALMNACAAGRSEPVLRFYAWSQPTISLGRFQDYAAYQQLPPPAGRLPVVRRITGGGAILHDLEVTYALVLPAKHPLVKGQPNHLYELAHAAIIAAIGAGARRFDENDAVCDASSQRGPFFCFARRHGLDVVIDDPQGPRGVSKIAGSAQRRTPQAILQHGSIMLDSRYPQQPVATWSALAGSLDFQAAVPRLIPAFEKTLGTKLHADTWTDIDLSEAQRIRSKYAGLTWTKAR